MSETTSQHRDASSAERTASITLWVVVAGALVYGVSETAVRVTQLFS